jgi:DNA-binding winged helix-turn-helix (wHTH) protein
VLDSDTRRLQREGQGVHLTPKAMELLELLVRSRPRAVSKTAIKGALWPDAHVGAGSLTVLAAELRTALGDDARQPTWIRTVFGFGYAFAGEGTDEPLERSAPAPVPSQPAFRVVWGRRTLPLAEGDNVLGREDDVGVRIDAAGISRRHALIRVRGAEAIIEDLGSKNGTHLRGGRLVAPASLKDGDVFVLGDVALVFRSSPLRGATATVPKSEDQARTPAK